MRIVSSNSSEKRIPSRFTTLIVTTLLLLGTACVPTKAPEPQELNRQLVQAAIVGKIALVKHLLEQGANIESTDDSGSAILAIAAEHGDLALVKLAIEKGAQVAAKDKYGDTALTNAIRSSNSEMVELLLKRTVDLTEKNRALFDASVSGPAVIENCG